MEIIKRSRFQRYYPESYFYRDLRRQDEAAQTAREDLENYYDKLYYSYSYSMETVKEKMMEYNNTRLQYLLTLYYFRHNTQGHMYFVYKSAYRACKGYQTFLYRFLWTDIKDFFWIFHLDFVATFKPKRWFTRNYENFEGASKFCDSYFKWLSQKLSEKGKVSFEEVQGELEKLLK
jgi:hypothetical protein